MEEHMDIEDRIAAYLMDNTTSDVSDPVLIKWIEENESNRKIFYHYKKIWDEAAYYMPMEEFDTDRAWKKVNAINQKKSRMSIQVRNVAYILSGVAASLLILFALSFMGLFSQSADTRISMATTYGNRSEVNLPDGSVIRLNSGSDITYTFNAKEKKREVQFQGEGFFDVAKSENPFIVKMANGLEVKVLGTSFNLQAYAEDKTIQASLVEGSIEMSHNKEKMVMKAGDMVLFDKETRHLARIDGIPSHAYGWLENKLYMEDMSLTEVCRHLERNYNVKITLQPGLGEKRYNGVINEETVTDVLDALSRLSEIKYTVKGKNISLTSKEIMPME